MHVAVVYSTMHLFSKSATKLKYLTNKLVIITKVSLAGSKK